MPGEGTLPRGRHAPPLEVRQEGQRRRLLQAAARVFARCGFADATAEAIAREAGMSKATFYAHFDNKEECIVALFDQAAAVALQAMADAARDVGDDPVDRLRASVRALLDVLAENREAAQTLLVEIIGAGPEAMERRDGVLTAFASVLAAENAVAARRGRLPALSSPHDAYAVVGAVTELASRQIRRREPPDIRELEPVIVRLVLGVLTSAR